MAQSPLRLPSSSTGPGAASAQVTFVGTATTVLRVLGFSILTDPNFLRRGQRAYVGLGITTRRLTEPAMSVGQLPDLDFILLSHHHGDHFDRIAAAGLDHDLPVITEPHAARKLTSQGFRRPIALPTWEAQTIERGADSVTVTSVPAKHAPVPLGYLIPPVMGSVLDFRRQGQRVLRMYITGDTLMHDGLTDIARRFPDIDLCLIHLGGTRIAGILLTMDARQGIEALRVIRPREAIPVHYDDYTLFKSPLVDFKAATEKSGLASSIRYLERGESYRVPLGTHIDHGSASGSAGGRQE